MQQPRQILGAADLHHLLHGLEINAEIQGAGAHHPANRAGLHRRFDRFPFTAVDGAVVEGQGVLHLRTGEAQALVPTLRLIAGVGEQQGADAGVQPCDQFFVHAQPQVPSPGEAINTVGKDAADLRGPRRCPTDDHRLPFGAEGMAGRLFDVADRGADGPGLQLGPVLSQPAQAELGLAAALAAHELMPFIQHHGVQLVEQLLRLGVAEQQRE